MGLNVAWQYLSKPDKASFKQQARDILRILHRIKPPVASSSKKPSYLVPDPDPVLHRGIQELENEILFSPSPYCFPLTGSGAEADVEKEEEDIGFTHNDFQESNIIVNDGKIVGVIDWEMAGFFGWKRAKEVHERIRGPSRENYAHLGLDEEFLNDILYWRDLYDA